MATTQNERTLAVGDKVRILPSEQGWVEDHDLIGQEGVVALVVGSDPNKVFVTVEGRPMPFPFDLIGAPGWPLRASELEAVSE